MEPPSPPPISPSHLPHAEIPEVSMVEAADVTGVTFTPELWMQRRHWALEVLRRERVRSVLDIGCGTGALLETLVMPASTICEPPIQSKSAKHKGSYLPSPVDSEGDEQEPDELFITRLGGLDSNPTTTPTALSVLTPPATSSSASGSSTFPPPTPRWEPLTTELWLGNMETYNSRLEGYECMTALEVIEHLDPHVLSRFGVVTMGTYRPRLLLVTTPNFDFNAKFPRAHDHEHAPKGFVDPTGRTGRVFRHSDHKLEMTNQEFVEWATAAAADWGYTVEISGVGVSSSPSYYPDDHPTSPSRPVFATQTAIFRIGKDGPARSPRSVRTIALPFMPGSSESNNPHKLAGKFIHPATAFGEAGLSAAAAAAATGSGSGSGSGYGSTRGPNLSRDPSASSRSGTPAFGGGNGHGTPASLTEVRDKVKEVLTEWQIGEVSLSELWSDLRVARECKGSKRYLVACLGGYGDVGKVQEEGSDGSQGVEWEVKRIKGRGLVVLWKEWDKPKKDQKMEVDDQAWSATATEPNADTTTSTSTSTSATGTQQGAAAATAGVQARQRGENEAANAGGW